MHIRPDEISVVIQGPVFGASGDAPEARWTQRAIESVRRVLPDAEIVLSTWKRSDLAGLDADIIIENADPGGTPHFQSKVMNNVNRQIVSTRAGLRAATRPFVLKIRSETILEHGGFIGYFGRFEAATPGKVLGQRVVTSTVPSPIQGVEPGHVCYSPSDWFYFGRREDVRDIWELPLAPEPDTTLWFLSNPMPEGVVSVGVKLRYAIEQYVWTTFLRKHHHVEFNSLWDSNAQTKPMSEASMAANLVLISPRQAGLRSLKYADSYDWGFWDHAKRGFFDHGHWRVLYETYAYRVPPLFRLWYPAAFSTARAIIQAARAVKRRVAA